MNTDLTRAEALAREVHACAIGRGGPYGIREIAQRLADEVIRLAMTARETPDPGDTWGWYADDVDTRPAPEGMQVFAHWSKSHAGVNVEIDAPDDLPLTVHVNDWRAVNVVVGTSEQATDD